MVAEMRRPEASIRSGLTSTIAGDQGVGAGGLAERFDILFFLHSWFVARLAADDVAARGLFGAYANAGLCRSRKSDDLTNSHP